MPFQLQLAGLFGQPIFRVTHGPHPLSPAGQGSDTPAAYKNRYKIWYSHLMRIYNILKPKVQSNSSVNASTMGSPLNRTPPIHRPCTIVQGPWRIRWKKCFILPQRLFRRNGTMKSLDTLSGDCSLLAMTCGARPFLKSRPDRFLGVSISETTVTAVCCFTPILAILGGLYA